MLLFSMKGFVILRQRKMMSLKKLVLTFVTIQHSSTLPYDHRKKDSHILSYCLSYTTTYKLNFLGRNFWHFAFTIN
jgi:hypothetical protein